MEKTYFFVLLFIFFSKGIASLKKMPTFASAIEKQR